MESLIKEYIDTFGVDNLKIFLEKSLKERKSKNLTIIANAGKHHIPNEVIYGEKYIFSEGSFDLAACKGNADVSKVIKEELKNNIKALSKKLKSEKWEEIYLILVGHSILSAHIKHLVYRVTRKDTIDVCFFPAHGFINIDLNLVDNKLYD